MKKKLSATLMAFMLVLQVLSSGFLMPMSAFAATNDNTATTQTDTKTQAGTEADNTKESTPTNATVQDEDSSKAVEEEAKQAVDSLFTNNQYTALVKDVTEWRINTVEVTVNKVTNDQVKQDLQHKVDLARAFVAVNALFTPTKDQLAKGVTQAAIDAADAKVQALVASEGKEILLGLGSKAKDLLKKNSDSLTKSNEESSKITGKTKNQTKSFKLLAEENTITENILTDMKLKIDGNDYSSGGTIDDLSNGTASDLHFEYELPKDHPYTAGSTFTFQLPPNFEMYNAIPEKNLDGDYGTFSVTKDGLVTVKFNGNIETVEGKNGVIGEINFSSKLIADPSKGNEQKITFTPVVGEQTFEFNVNFTKPTVASKDKKDGQLNQPFNPTSATWTVLLNSQNKELNNGKIVDILPEGMEYDGDLTITPKQLLMDGTLKDLEPISITPDISEDKRTLTIPLGKTSYAYEIRYKTKIVGDIKDTYKNTVSLKDTDTIIGEEQSKTLTPKKGVDFKKTSKGLTDDQKHIKWKVEFNGNQKSYEAGLKLKDLVGTGSFDKDSLKAYKANVDSTNGDVSQTTDVVADATADEAGVITFANAIDHQAIILEYTTSINETNDNGGVDEVTNSIGFYDESSENNIKNSVTQKFSWSGTGINKTASNPNYTDKTVNWTIDANSAGNKIAANSVFTDTFGIGLHYVEDSINVKVGNNELASDDYEFTETTDPEGFTLKLKNATSESIKITYKTSFDLTASQTDVLQYTNGVGFTYKNQFDKQITISKNGASFTPNQQTKDNGYKKGVYDLATKRVNWTVGINYNLKTITMPIVTDTLEEADKFTIDPGTFKVYQLTGVNSSNQTEVDASQYDVEFTPNNKSFTLTFNNSINSAYEIEYETTDDDQIYEGSYTNTATLKDGLTLLSTLTNTVNGKDNADNPNDTGLDNYIEKTGQQDIDNPDYLNWTLKVNQAQSKVGNATIEDEPQGYQILKEDSIKIYEMKVENNKLVRDASAQVSSTDYEVTQNMENGAFTIKFKNQISKAYQVEYQTYFLPEKNEGNISNKAKFKGDSINSSEEPKSGSAAYRSSIAWGTSIANATSLTIKKIDRNSQDILPGAEFSLYADEDLKTKMDTQTTKADGTVKFYRLVPDRYYYLVEDNAPTSYEKNRVLRVKAEDNSSIVVDNVLAENACTQFEIQYTAPTGVDLSNVEFDIYEGKKKLNLSPITVGADGKLQNLPILEKGKTYKVIQIKGTPNGYNRVAQNVTVSNDCTENLVEVTNKPQTTCSQQTIQVKKEDDTDLNHYTAIFTKLDGSETKSVTTTDSKVTIPEGFNEGTYTVTIQGIGFTIEDVEPAFDDDCNFVVKISDGDKCEQQIIKVVDKDGNSITDETFIKKSTFELVEKNSNKKYKDLVIDENGQLGSVTDDGTFKALTSIEEGTYKLVQTTAPVGYKPITTDIVFDGTKCLAKVVIDLTDPGAVCDQFDITVVGTNKTTAIVDIDFYDQFVSGSKFKLVDQEGNTIKSGEIELNDLTINDHGKIVKAIDESEKVIGTDLSINPGSYKLVQTTTPEGFIALNKDVVVYQQDNGCNAIVQIDTDNRELKCDTFANFEVVGATGQQATDLANQAEFKVVDSNGDDVAGATGLKVVDGKVNVPDLSPGTYKLIQTKAPAGYYAASPQEFVVSADTCTSLITVKNYQIPSAPTPTCPIEFNVVDSKTNNGIGNATFEVKQNGVTVATVTSDASGKVSLPALTVGDYQLVQTSSKAGYDFSKEPISFSVKNDNGTCTVTISTVKNDPKTCPVDITVIDADATNIKVAGATFTIKDKDGKVIAENVTSDKDGKIIVKGLVAGDYTLVQTSVPNGYEKSADVSFTVKTKEDGTCENTVVVVKNVPKQCDVVFINKDEETGKVVKGSSTFVVKDQDGKTVTTVTSDSNGKITVAHLKPGTYELVQQKAPSGYEEQSGTITFTVKKGECGPNIVIDNVKVDKPKDPKNDNNKENGKTPNKNKDEDTTSPNNNKASKGGNNSATFKVTDKDHAHKYKDDVYKLVDENGKTIASGLKVNKDGNIVVEGLPDGDYHLVKLPQTGVQTSLYASLMGLVLVLLGGYAIYRGRRKKSIM